MISAIILAAGQSKRMGQPKMLLPWGNVTVLEQVISVFAQAGCEEILVVVGGWREKIQEVISECAKRYPVQSVINKDYEKGEMLSSIQCGLGAINSLRTDWRSTQQTAEEGVRVAAMLGLGDQPQVEERSVWLVREAFLQTGSPLVVPSFQMRRGHPWLVRRSLWGEVLDLKPSQTPRDFLNAHTSDIHYVTVDSPSILADLDTPEDYAAARPR